MKYILTNTAPKTAIVQSIPSGNFDFSEFENLEAAIEAATDEIPEDAFVQFVEDEFRNITEIQEITREEMKAQVSDTLKEYTREEILEAAEQGYGWPEELGFVEEVAFVLAEVINENVVEVSYDINDYLTTITWTNLHEGTGEVMDFFYPDIKVESSDPVLEARVAEAIRLGEDDENSDLYLYLHIRDTFSADDVKEIAANS